MRGEVGEWGSSYGGQLNTVIGILVVSSVLHQISPQLLSLLAWKPYFPILVIPPFTKTHFCHIFISSCPWNQLPEVNLYENSKTNFVKNPNLLISGQSDHPCRSCDDIYPPPKEWELVVRVLGRGRRRERVSCLIFLLLTKPSSLMKSLDHWLRVEKSLDPPILYLTSGIQSLCRCFRLLLTVLVKTVPILSQHPHICPKARVSRSVNGTRR